MYVNIKTQKEGLNMNPACSVSLCVYEWQRCDFVYYTDTEAHVMNSRWFSASASHYMNLVSHFMRILLFHFRKLASYYTVY